MTASFLSFSFSSSLQRVAGCALSLALAALVAIGCTHATSDAHDPAPLVTVTGDFLADGSCHATANGVALFASGDRQRTSLDAGAVADIAPAGFTMHQLACAPADAEPGTPDRAGDRAVLITLYARTGEALRAGRYAVRAGLADGDDAAGVATRAGVAIFGAPVASAAGGAGGAGVRYLEGREGTLDITSVDSTSADGAHVVGRFNVRAQPAWSM